ncbi:MULTISPECIES: DUF3783 domain-containing protein [unclassified Ruminococcus]|uniref:DUF3783 domain-containing protein n=1 Tax=unclassified Ruminococcus TaxID=2608920 RepID=UPI0021090765|nr:MULTISPECIES: DUF3783 domain-containing protein [unclassified Ruminococcus]MCQ4021572.1 DUF3783 domain-containing protein [Ruminococcus sp. zg-924]MCQ4114017.1 DUF3783 domain-containing protein [Ruminococcus sp. zg-921]
MKETVLLYNFSDERLAKIQRALLPLKIRIKAVSINEYSQPLGYLAGIKDIEPTDEKFSGDGFTDELMLICGLNNTKLEALLRSLYKYGVGRIDLKAMLTPTNISWNSTQLYKAVKADHEEMNRNKAAN